MPTLQADLELQIDEALAQLGALDEALQQSAVNFGDALATAIATLAGEALLPVDADIAPAQGEVDALISDVEGSVASVTVDADTGPALSAEEDAVAAMDSDTATLTVDADTTEAQGALDDLDTSLSGVQAAAKSGSSGLGEFAGSAGLLAASGKLAKGEIGGVQEGIGAVAPTALTAAGGLLALVGATHELITAGIEGLSAEQRFNAVLGEQAAAVEKVNVGNLTIDLRALGNEMGTTDAALENGAATIFQFAKNANASNGDAVKFTDTLFALAARAVALKPELGDVSDVASRMTVGLGRARSAAQQFGIAVSQAEINTRALKDTGKQSASDLTAYEKSVAGAEIAIERYGGTLHQVIEKGSQNAAIEQRKLKAEFDNFLESAGKQLVVPAFDALKAGIPVAEGIAGAFSDVAAVAIPLLTGALQILGPLIQPVVTGLLAFEGIKVISSIIGLVADGLLSLAIASPLAETGILGVAAAAETAEVGIQAAAGPIGIILGLLSLGAVAFGLFGSSADDSSKQVDDFAKSVEESNGALTDAALKSARAIFQQKGQIDDIAKAGLNFADVVKTATAATKGQRDDLGKLITTTNELASAQALLDTSTGANQQNAARARQSVAELKREQEGLLSTLRQSNPVLAQQLELLLRTQPGNSGIVKTILDLGDANSSAVAKVRELQAANATGTGVQATQNDVTQAAKIALEGYAAGTISASDALKAQTDAQKGATDALSLYKLQLEGVLGLQGDVTAATVSFKDSQQGVLDALAKNGVQFDINSQAGRDNVKALESSASAAVALSEATFKQTGSQAQADAVMQTFSTNLETTLISLGQTKQGADDLLTSLGLFPTFAPPTTDALGAVGDAFAAVGPFASAAAVAAANSGASVEQSTATSYGAAADTTRTKSAEIAGAAQKGADDAQKNFETGLQKIPTAVEAALGQALVALTLGLIPLVTDASIAGVTVGEALGSGILAGIAIGSAGVEQAAAAVVTRAEGAARTAAKAKSPSQLFADIGIDLGLGLALGLGSQTDAVATQAQGLVTAASKAVSASTLSLPEFVVAAPQAGTGGAQTAAAAAPLSQAHRDASFLGAGPLIGQLVVEPTTPDPVGVGIEVARKVQDAAFRNGW